MANNINTAYQDALRDRANELPAPRTIAASKADVLSNLAFFFGDPVVPERLRDYSEHHAMTFHFPDAYYGQNTKIRETLNNLILKSPQEWHTQVALPFVKVHAADTTPWNTPPVLTHLCFGRSSARPSSGTSAPRPLPTLPLRRSPPPCARRIRFDVRLLQRVPYEGISRMSTSLRRRHRDRVVRCTAQLERAAPITN